MRARWLGVLALALLAGAAALVAAARRPRPVSESGAQPPAARTAPSSEREADDPEAPFPPGLGVDVPLHDPSGRALESFHRALARVEAGEEKARLLFYGASHTAVDHYVGRLREALQRRYGDAGRGFALAAWPHPQHYWQWGVRIDEGRGWDRLRLGAERAEADHYGLAGIVFDSAGREATARVATSEWGVGQRASRLEVWYQAQPGGGALEVRVDGTLRKRIATHAPSIEAGFATFDLEDGPHEVEMRALPGAPVRLYGVVLEREGPGVVVDNAGLSGARARLHLKWLDPVYTQHLERRAPDLVSFSYGGNEGNDFGIPISTYASRTERALARLRRTVPDASCLIIGPPDKPVFEDGEWAHRPRTTSIARVQRRLAEKHGCAFFDTIAFMGGRLSMLRWVAADPPLGRPDRVHFTARGYHRMAEVLLAGLLDGHAGRR
ncbi:MAG: GDSL-type esterase/lipase family protein [Myxococcota bacterium]